MHVHTKVKLSILFAETSSSPVKLAAVNQERPLALSLSLARSLTLRLNRYSRRITPRRHGNRAAAAAAAAVVVDVPARNFTFIRGAKELISFYEARTRAKALPPINTESMLF